MLASIVLLAATCVGPAYWVPTDDATICSVERQEIPGACSNFMKWDDVPGAEYYEIERALIKTRYRTISVPKWRAVGQTTGTVWWFYDDDPLMPGMARATFIYRARSCNQDDECFGASEIVKFARGCER